MKKYLLLIVAVLGLLIMPNVKAEELPEVTDHEKVKVYLFRGEGCSHCYDFLTYFIDTYKDYEDYFEIVVYESWKNSANQELMLAVKEKVGEDVDTAVPFIVVGSNYEVTGFNDEIGEKIIATALKEYQSDKYSDLVAKVAKSEKVNPNAESIKEAALSEGVAVSDTDTEEEKDKGISDGVVIGIVFGVLILGFGGLVVLSRKQ